MKGILFFFFFFQAEDGIRDWSVTGVQTCALPISARTQRRRLRAEGHDAAGSRARDHCGPADEGRRDHDGRGRMTASAPESAAPSAAPLEPEESLGTRLWENVKGGNLGSWPVIFALVLIVLVFSQTAENFFTPGNFTNIITQMAGTCLLAYGVV